MQDSKNVVIFVMGLLVVFLVLKGGVSSVNSVDVVRDIEKLIERRDVIYMLQEVFIVVFEEIVVVVDVFVQFFVVEVELVLVLVVEESLVDLCFLSQVQVDSVSVSVLWEVVCIVEIVIEIVVEIVIVMQIFIVVEMEFVVEGLFFDVLSVLSQEIEFFDDEIEIQEEVDL